MIPHVYVLGRAAALLLAVNGPTSYTSVYPGLVLSPKRAAQTDVCIKGSGLCAHVPMRPAAFATAQRQAPPLTSKRPTRTRFSGPLFFF
jgi:hypothetical protein